MNKIQLALDLAKKIAREEAAGGYKKTRSGVTLLHVATGLSRQLLEGYRRNGVTGREHKTTIKLLGDWYDQNKGTQSDTNDN